ncbi:MAG: carbon monoxide dehydrogenase subunit G [Ottowia sp.]|nr:carbon monoxide dehydrogenase subunit G [Ottowia sp.]
MEMTGQREVPVSQQAAWDALNDPEVLKACIPGCESLELDQEGGGFKAVVRAAVGPVRARLKGRVDLSDIVAPESYKLAFKGEGATGFAQGESEVRLVPSEAGAGTLICYTANAKIGGKLAQVGSRLIDSAANKLAGEFFSNLTQHLGGESEEKPSDATATEPAKKKKGMFGFMKKDKGDKGAAEAQ